MKDIKAEAGTIRAQILKDADDMLDVDEKKNYIKR